MSCLPVVVFCADTNLALLLSNNDSTRLSLPHRSGLYDVVLIIHSTLLGSKLGHSMTEKTGPGPGPGLGLGPGPGPGLLCWHIICYVFV